MGWETSDRRASLPRDWHRRRQRAKTRSGGQCEQVGSTGKRCPRPGTDAHHTGESDDHDEEKLQWLCRPHHDVQTNRQAKQSQHDKYVAAKRRKPESHPGVRGAPLPWMR